MILVSGGTGFVGRSLVDALLARGDSVRVLSRSPSLPPRPNLTVVTGDLLDDESVRRAVHGARAVVHLAARLPARDDRGSAGAEVNARMTDRLAQAAREAGVERLVHVSSGGIYGEGATPVPHRESDPPRPVTPYQRSKLAAELALSERLAGSGVRWTILRPPEIFGPARSSTAAFFAQVRRRRLWLHASPNVIVQPTYISDVVQACLLTLDASVLDAPVINVAGERALRFQELVALTAGVLGVSVVQLVLPQVVGLPIARATARLARTVGLPVPSVVERAARPHCNRALDITLARRCLGFKPVPLEAALADTARALGLGGSPS